MLTEASGHTICCMSETIQRSQLSTVRSQTAALFQSRSLTDCVALELVTAPLCALGSLTRWSFWGGGDVIGVIPVEKWSWRSLASALAAIVIVVAHVRKTLADDSRVSAGRDKPRTDSWAGALAEADNFISAVLELRALYIWTHRTGDRCVSDSSRCQQQGWWVSVSCQTSSWIFF